MCWAKDTGKFLIQSFNFYNLLTIASTFTTKFYSPSGLQQHSNPSKYWGLQEDKCGKKNITERTIFHSVMFHLLCVWCGVVSHSEAALWCHRGFPAEDNPALRIPQEEVGKPLQCLQTNLCDSWQLKTELKKRIEICNYNCQFRTLKIIESSHNLADL